MCIEQGMPAIEILLRRLNKSARVCMLQMLLL
jgi:hypothetical protein